MMQPDLVAISRFVERAEADFSDAERRWLSSAQPAAMDDLRVWADRFASAGRLTLNFHPDRLDRHGRTVAEGLLEDGRYRSQWRTGISAGSRSAVPGGERHRFEDELFDGAYATADPEDVEHPVYGALDLLFDPHGGSPRFGSSFLILGDHCRERTTLCFGDSATRPRDVGTAQSPWTILAALAEQASHGNLLNRGLDVDVLLAALNGTHRSLAPSRDLDGYIEAQVHGGVSLAEDADATVLDPSFRGTQIEEHFRRAAEQFDFSLAWHEGSELHVDRVPSDFRGPTMPPLARRVARSEGIVDARSIGEHARTVVFAEPASSGDHTDSDLQQLKYLWHTLMAFGENARA